MKIKNFLKFSIFLLIVNGFLIACNIEKDNEEKHETKKARVDTISSITYEKLPLIKDFSGKVFLFIDHPDTMECNQSNNGDCNGFDILFLDKENYIILIYCLYKQWVTQGKYKVEGNKIFFISDSLSISLEKNDYNLMVDSWDCIDIEYSKMVKDSTTQFQCKDKMYLKWNEKDYIYYGFYDSTKSIQSEVQNLKNDSTWYKLGKK